MLRMCDIASPQTGLEAKFSLRLMMALQILGYDTAALDTYTDAVCVVPSITALRDRVEVKSDDKLTDTQAVVTITNKTGIEKTAQYDLSDPMPFAEKQSRIMAKSASLLGDAIAKQVWKTVSAEQVLPVL